MTDKEVLIDFYATYWQQVQKVLHDMPHAAITWSPNSDIHCIAVLGWHLGRSLDLLTVRLLRGQPSGHELWYTDGWCERMDYDPTGIGYGGFGNLAGYTPWDIDAIPLMTVSELLRYFNSAYDQLVAYLNEMIEEELGVISADMRHLEQTKYEWLRNFLNDGRQTLGTIKTMRSMWLHSQESLMR